MNKKQNAEEDYITTPISVLAYITDLERQLEEAREVFRLVNLENQLLHEEVNRLNESINELKEKGE